MKHPCWPGHVTVLQWIRVLAFIPPLSHPVSRPAQSSIRDQPSEFALSHSPCCTHPSLRICPRPHAQCPNLVRSALFTLSPTSQLRLGCASQRPPQPAVSNWLHPTHVKSNFEDQPNSHTLCSFPVCFIHSRPELTREVHMYRPHQRSTHNMKGKKKKNSTQFPNPPVL